MHKVRVKFNQLVEQFKQLATKLIHFGPETTSRSHGRNLITYIKRNLINRLKSITTEQKKGHRIASSEISIFHNTVCSISNESFESLINILYVRINK